MNEHFFAAQGIDAHRCFARAQRVARRLNKRCQYMETWSWQVEQRALEFKFLRRCHRRLPEFFNV